MNIEQHPEYLAFLEEANKTSPEPIYRTEMISERRRGKLWIGVKLNNGNFYWMEDED